MTQIFKLQDRKFIFYIKHVIKMLRILMEKVNNIQKQMSNVNREKEIIIIKRKC